MSTPPPTRRDATVDELHGRRIADPYRWLEDLDAEDTREWIGSQNAATAAYLDGIPGRAVVREHMAALWDHPRSSPPFRRGRRWFQLRNTGLQDQDVLWSVEADDESSAPPPPETWTVLLDPNGLSDDGTVSLSGLGVTDDGARIAYGLSEAGSDWRTWYVRDVGTGEDAEDAVPWSKFSPAAWLPDGSGFLYGAFDPPDEGDEYEAANRNMELRLHRLGTATGEDAVVYARPDQPEWNLSPTVTHDDRWLVITIARGTDPTNRVHVAPIESGAVGEVRPLLDRDDARYHLVGAVGDELWFETDLDAPTGRVVAVHPDRPDEVREVVATTDDRLEDAHLVGGAAPGDPGWLVLTYLHHAATRIAVHDLEGSHLHDLDLPELGTAGNAGSREGGITGGRHDDAVHLAFESFTSPVRILRHEPGTATTTEAVPAGLPSRDDLVTRQVFVDSGGVRVPLFLVHRADVTPTGNAPTLLWGYGGFDIAVTPHFRTPWRVWVELGGVLAIACLRGGGEYGREWHDDGRLTNKQHVFDDVLAVAGWLTGEGSATTLGGDPVDDVWTAPDHLGIEGRSNGGLLVGAAITQRPELFGSAVPEVGVLDMLRFHRFTIGWAWTSDYGSPDDPEAFATLMTYSPLHNLQQGACYPPTLVTTGDHDDRVVPGHSYKFAAALQHAQGCDAPIRIRIDTSAGHGVGKPVGKLVDERTDVVSWHAHHLGLDVTA